MKSEAFAYDFRGDYLLCTFFATRVILYRHWMVNIVGTAGAAKQAEKWRSRRPQAHGKTMDMVTVQVENWHTGELCTLKFEGSNKRGRRDSRRSKQRGGAVEDHKHAGNVARAQLRGRTEAASGRIQSACSRRPQAH